jgi:DNA-binding response OmpR family regulator
LEPSPHDARFFSVAFHAAAFISGFAPSPTLLELHHFQLVGPMGKTTITASDSILLSALAQAPGQRLETWQLAEMLSKDVEAFNKASLEVKIVRLRKKITQVGGSEEAIKSIRLYGYQLCVPLKLC